MLAGRRIAAASGWASVLSRFVARLAPERLPGSALPGEVLTDQVGSLLALVGGESETRGYAELGDRIGSLLRERCADPDLASCDIALALDIPNPLVYLDARRLRPHFPRGPCLRRAPRPRLRCWARAAGGRLPLGKSAQRCGFCSAGQCVGAVHAHSGLAPGQLRRRGRGTNWARAACNTAAVRQCVRRHACSAGARWSCRPRLRAGDDVSRRWS